MAKKESSSPGFVLVYMIPLLLYYFISYKIYMSSIDDKTGLRRKDVDPKSKIAFTTTRIDGNCFFIGLQLHCKRNV